MEHPMQADVEPGTHLQVCRTCLATDCKTFPMTFSTVLNNAYETLTGTRAADNEHLPGYLCGECTETLFDYVRLQHRSLQARLMLLDIVKRHGSITVEFIRSIKERNNSFSGDFIRKPIGISNGGLTEVNELSYAQDDTRVEVDMYNNIHDLKSEIDYAIDHNRVNNEEVVKVENDNWNIVEGLNGCSSRLDDNILVDNDVADDNDIIDEDNHNSCILDEDIVVDDILAQNDMINREDVSESSFGSEQDVDVVTIDTVVDYEVTTSKSLVYSATFYEDSVCDVLRMEHNDTSSTVSTPKAREMFSDNAKDHAFYFVGEDVLADPCVILEQRQKGNMAPALHEMQLNRRQTPAADGGPVPYTDNTLRCDICQYQTVSVIQLLKHLKAHAASEYYCDVCHYKTNEKRKLRVHVRTHFDDKRYVCNICKRTFNYKQSLTNHMKIHLGKKSHVCNICKNGFRLQRELRLHLVTHSGKQLYSCDVCQKTFALKVGLRRHLALHTEEKKYSCDICKSSFAEKGNLSKHLMIHSARKPYPCDVCKKQFQHKHHLQKHVLIHSRPSVKKPYRSPARPLQSALC